MTGWFKGMKERTRIPFAGRVDRQCSHTQGKLKSLGRAQRADDATLSRPIPTRFCIVSRSTDTRFANASATGRCFWVAFSTTNQNPPPWSPVRLRNFCETVAPSPLHSRYASSGERFHRLFQGTLRVTRRSNDRLRNTLPARNYSPSHHPRLMTRFSSRPRIRFRSKADRRPAAEMLEARRMLAAELGIDTAFLNRSDDFETDPQFLSAFHGPVLPGRPIPPIQAFVGKADDDFPTAEITEDSSPAPPPPFPLDQTFRLHSRPDSDFTIYLDFDGHTTRGTSWNSGYNLDTIVHPDWWGGTGTSFSNSRLELIQEVWQIVAEDFAPFDVNVTTEAPIDLDDLRYNGSGDTRWGTRAVMTKDTFADCGCGGHAYLGSFDDRQDEPTFVYNRGRDAGSETISHEVGHQLGLRHDGNGSREYYRGHGSGVTSWGPIMGSPFSKKITQWNDGDYYDASRPQQDDLAVITGSSNMPYRDDDHANDFFSASPLHESETVNVHAFGVIERNDDVDWFHFVTGGGEVSIDLDVLGYKPNLDVWAGLYDSSGVFVSDANPQDSLSAAFHNIALDAGEYFIKIDGVARDGVYDSVLGQYVEPDPPPYTVSGPLGYSDYGSLGQYRISGTVTATASATVSIAADSTVVREGDVANVTLTTSDGGDAEITVLIRPASQTAPGQSAPDGTELDDFEIATTQTVSVIDGRASLQIPITEDSKIERNESFDVVIVDAGAYRVADRTTTVRVIESLTAFAIVSEQATGREGDDDATTQTFTVQRIGNYETRQNVGWRLLGNGDHPADAADFLSADEGMLIFESGETSRVLQLQIAGDLDLEADETYAIELFVPPDQNFAIEPSGASAIGEIQDDESIITLASSARYRLRQVAFDDGDFDHWAFDNFVIQGTGIGDDFDPEIGLDQWASIVEGTTSNRFPQSQGNALFFSGSTERSASTVPASPMPGAAIDFSLIFADSNTDGLNATENGEDVVLEYSLNGIDWSELQRFDEAEYPTWSEVHVTLPPEATFTPASFSENDSGTQLRTLSINRSGFVGKAVAVDWAITPTGQHPVSGDDFDGGLPSGTLRFATGESSATIDIALAGDTIIEEDETFLISLANHSGGPIEGNTLIGMIVNDDFATPEIQVSGLEGQVIANGDEFPTPDDGTDFGLAAVNGASVTRQFEIQNIGALDLNVNSIVLAGPHAADFAVVEAGQDVLPPGHQTIVEVAFTPMLAGRRNAELVINNNDPDEGVHSFVLTGLATDLQVQQVVINDGRPSRSQLESVRVTFNRTVDHQTLSRAFEVYQLGPSQFFPSLTVDAVDAGGRTDVTLTFNDPSGTTTPDLINSVFPDGYFALRVSASMIGTPGNDPLVMYQDFLFGTKNDAIDANDGFFRLFGDSDGDADVDVQDFGAFAKAFRSDSTGSRFNALLDYERDGDIDSRDLTEFRLRLGGFLR